MFFVVILLFACTGQIPSTCDAAAPCSITVSDTFCSTLLLDSTYTNCTNVTVLPSQDPTNARFGETCILDRSLRFVCAAPEIGEDIATFTCPRSDPCFAIPITASNVSVAFDGCGFLGGGIRVLSSDGTTDVTIDRCWMDGRQVQPLVEVSTVLSVTIRNTYIANGYLSRSSLGGGCVSLSRVFDFVWIENVTVLNCVSARDGGGILINGDNSTELKALLPTPDRYTPGPGTVTIVNTTISSSQSTASRGGCLAIRFMGSVRLAQVSLRHCRARLTEGCMQMLYLTDKATVSVTSVDLYNCSVVTDYDGCGTISIRNNGSIYISNMTISHCRTFLGIGMEIGCAHNLVVKDITVTDSMTEEGITPCLNINNISFGTVENVYLRNCFAKQGSYTGFYMRLVQNIVIRNVTIVNSSAAVDGGAGIGIGSSENIVFEDVEMTQISTLQPPDASCILITHSRKLTFINTHLSCYDPTSKQYIQYHTPNAAPNALTIVDKDLITESDFVRDRTVTVPFTKRVTPPRGSSNIVFYSTQQDVPVQTTFVASKVAVLPSGPAVFSSSWLGVLQYDCNVYFPTVWETWIRNSQDIDDHPRVINLVVNLCIIGIVFVLDGLVVGFQHVLHHTEYRQSSHPNATFRVFALLLCEVVTASVTCLWVDRFVCGILGLVVSACFIGWLIGYHLRDGIAGHMSDECYAISQQKQIQYSTLESLLMSNGVWKDTTASRGIVKKLGFLFDVYTGSTAFRSVVLDVSVSAVQGVLGGLQVTTEAECSGLYGASVALYSAVFAYVAFVWSPHHTRRDRIGYLAVIASLIAGNLLKLSEHAIFHSAGMLKPYVTAVVSCGLLANIVCTGLFICGEMKGPTPTAGESKNTKSDYEKIATCQDVEELVDAQDLLLGNQKKVDDVLI